MKAPAMDQRNNAQASLAISDTVDDDGGVLAVDCEHSLLDSAISCLITESWEWIAEKLFEVFEPLRMDSSWVLVVGKGVSVYLLIKRGQKEPSVYRRIQGCHEKSVIRPGVSS
jgi:hypothetical protein